MKKFIAFVQRHPMWFSALVFFFLALLVTQPLVFELSSSIYGERSDNLSTIWYLWYWTHGAPTADPLLNYPVGTVLEFRSTDWLSLGPTLLLAFISNEVVAFNLTVILSFFLSGWLMFLLLRKFTQSWAGPIIGGFVLMALPYHLAMSAYHFSLMRIEVFPLLLLALYAFEQRRSWKSFAWLTLALAACAYINPHYGVFAVLIAFIYFFVYCIRRRSKFAVWQGIGVLALFVVVTLPLYLDVAGRSSEVDLLEARPFSQLFQYAAKPVAYVMPYLSGNSGYRQALADLPSGIWHEQALFLGYFSLLLAVLGVVYLWKKSKPYLSFLLLLGLAGFLFSLPPTINVFGADVPMPSNFLYSILPLVRTLSRFGVLVGLAIAALAGFGMHYALQKFPQPWLRATVSLLVVLVIAFEFGLGLTTLRVATAVAPVDGWLKDQPTIRAIAEYPLNNIPAFDDAGQLNLWQFYQDRLAQRTHQKPLFNGPAEGFFNQLKKQLVRLDGPATAARLNWLGIDTVLVHEDRLSSEEIQYLRSSNDFEPLAEFDTDVVYRITANSLEYPGGLFRSPVNSNFDQVQDYLHVAGTDLLIYGPYLALTVGDYQAVARLKMLRGNATDLMVNVVSDNGRIMLSEQSVTDAMLIEETVEIPLEFNVEAPGLENVEVRLYASELVEVEWLGMTLSRLPGN